ncbi:MAG TPA: biopolymer transporter ExbD [Acidobacteriota bacterium]|nr:biopolymer transporter ExbD [Acidobacteriota bacterium]
MAMAVGPSGSLRSEINVTPLVDVVLVLLIIFMVVTPLLQMGYSVNVPPKATAAESTVMSKEQLIVTQNEPNKVFLNREQINLDQLPLRLHDILTHRNDKTVFYSADDHLNYGAVMNTMDIIRNAGADRIGIITEQVNLPDASQAAQP